MTPATSAVSPRSGGAAALRPVLTEGDDVPTPDFDFALKKTDRSADRTHDTADLDRVVEHLYRQAHDAEAIKQAASAMRRTIETSLWQSAHRSGSRLPQIHAELFGRAVGLYAADRLRWLAAKFHEWLVLLSSPRRLCWGIKAAWNGDDVTQFVRERACWHRVDEIAVFERDRPTPIVRVGEAVALDEDDWLASNPIFGVTGRYLDDSRHRESTVADGNEDALPMHSMVVVGRVAEIAARITGQAPAGYREKLQAMCEAADAIVGDHEAGRAEQVFRLKQLVAPAVSRKESVVARQFWNPIVILACALMLGALLLGSAGVAHLQWTGVVNQIDAEPGIEVISSSLAWGHRQMELLRDPNATPVAELLLRYGCDPAEVMVRERPFVSADEAMIVSRQQSARPVVKTSGMPVSTAAADANALRGEVLADVRLDVVRSTLDLPSDVELTFANGELSARGALVEPGWTRLANAPRRFTWIKKLNLDQFRDLTAENIAKLQSSLENYRIEFVPASAILPDASKLRLQSVASELTMLAHDARLKQQRVRVQFRVTDPTLDLATTDARVALVRRELDRQDVPSACFVPPVEHLNAPNPGAIAVRIVLEPLSDTP